MFLGCDWLIRVQLIPNITQNSAKICNTVQKYQYVHEIITLTITGHNVLLHFKPHYRVIFENCEIFSVKTLTILLNLGFKPAILNLAQNSLNASVIPIYHCKLQLFLVLTHK